MEKTHNEPLHVMDKDEFFDVYRQFRPGADREEYELEWEEFQRCKLEHEQRNKLA